MVPASVKIKSTDGTPAASNHIRLHYFSDTTVSFADGES